MASTIHVHVDPHFSGWLVRLQKLNGSWANIDADLTDGSSNVTFSYSPEYPVKLRAYLSAQSRGGDDYEEDYAPTSSGMWFYEEQEVWFTLNPNKIPSDDPPTVTTQSATSLAWDNGTFHATLNGTVTQTGGATVVERGFDWDVDSGAPYANSWTENGSWGTGSFSHLISGLGVKIYFRAKARNSEGWGYGGELSFDPPPRPPTVLCWTPDDEDWDNGTFHGTLAATITDTGGATVLERGFDWDYDSGAPYANDWTEEGSFGLGNYDHYISGLTAKVYFRAKARNSAGWGYSSEKSFGPPVDPPTVTTQAATGIIWENGTFQATLHGTITDTGGENCDRRGFQWGYSSGNYPYSYSYVGSFGTGSFQHVAGSLASGRVYFRATARNSADWSYGSELYFDQPPSDAVTMIGGPSGFVWGTPLAQLSVVRRTTDGGLTWIWTTVVGTVTIPNGGPEAWIWDEVTLYVEG